MLMLAAVVAGLIFGSYHISAAIYPIYNTRLCVLCVTGLFNRRIGTTRSSGAAPNRQLSGTAKVPGGAAPEDA